MQSVEELNYLVKMGAISEEEADTVINHVIDQIEANKMALQQKVGFVKEAKLEPWTMLLTGLLGSAALTGMGVGTHYLTEYLDERKQEKKMDEAFSLMKKVNPDIKNVPLDQQRQSFSVLKAVSPTIAKNPVLAANFVQRQSMNYGGAGFEEAANLARAEGAMAPRSEGIGKQISANLINQGIGSMAGSVGAFTRKGIDQSFEDPERIGKDRAIAAAAELQTLEELTGKTVTQREQELAAAKAIGKERGMVQGVRGMNADDYMDAARLKGQSQFNQQIGVAQGQQNIFDARNAGDQQAARDIASAEQMKKKPLFPGFKPKPIGGNKK